MIATSGFLAALKCIKFVFGRAPSGPRWGAYSAPPDPLAGLRGPTSKGRGGEGEGKGEKKGKGRVREGPVPLSQIPGSASGETKLYEFSDEKSRVRRY